MTLPDHIKVCRICGGFCYEGDRVEENAASALVTTYKHRQLEDCIAELASMIRSLIDD
jgi:hypothetical protein